MLDQLTTTVINKPLSFFRKPNNSFGYPVFSPLVIFHNSYSELRRRIFMDMSAAIFSEMEWSNIEGLIAEIISDELDRDLPIKEIELNIEYRFCHEVFNRENVSDSISNRAVRISEQIFRALQLCGITPNQASSYLDFGCGSGVVAKLITEGYSIKNSLLTDVLDYRYDEVKDHSGLKFERGKFQHLSSIPSDSYDLVTITNVLHHCNEPLKIFQNLTNDVRKGAYILLIESCIGLTVEMTTRYKMDDQIPYQNVFDQNGKINLSQTEYLKMNFAEQMIYGSFFDWLYNRAFVNNDINVPCNFGTPDDWNTYFCSQGFKIVNTYLLGMDQPSVLEYHTMHIIRKE